MRFGQRATVLAIMKCAEGLETPAPFGHNLLPLELDPARIRYPMVQPIAVIHCLVFQAKRVGVTLILRLEAMALCKFQPLCFDTHKGSNCVSVIRTRGWRNNVERNKADRSRVLSPYSVTCCINWSRWPYVPGRPSRPVYNSSPKAINLKLSRLSIQTKPPPPHQQLQDPRNRETEERPCRNLSPRFHGRANHSVILHCHLHLRR